MSQKAYEEIVDFIATGTTPETVINFRPSPEAEARIQSLLDKKQIGELTPDEGSELDEYLQFEHVMILAKARARQRIGA